MIDEIHVENLALIKEAFISPSPGMTAITGETGAGKTALIASCRLIMGGRADKSMVREGSDEAYVEARLFKSGEGESHEDASELVVSRKVSSDGRSRAKLNGRIASISELAEEVGPSIDLCSQHDQQLLASPATQRALLDSWCGVCEDGKMQAYKDAMNASDEAKAELEDIKRRSQASDVRIQDAKIVLRQIDSLNPSQEDYDEICAALRKAENAELLARTSSEAYSALSDEGGALDNLNAAVALLEDGSRGDESLAQMASSLREAVYIAEDVSRDIGSFAGAIELDVGELEFMQERAASYQAVLRAYGPSMDDVLRARRDAQSIVDAVENADEAISRAKKKLESAEAALLLAADELSASRLAGAPGFSKSANSVLSRLHMQGASIEFQVKRLPRESWLEEGPDEVRILFAPAQGMQPRLLSRIASGGELSRVMLAIRAVMGDRDNVSSLVFDEIDAGIGGEAALALGDVLGDLSKTHQVVVVTHLAQIAAMADVHYIAVKREQDQVPVTLFKELEGDERTRELARMLSGKITESSLAHAEELLFRRS